MGFFSWLFGGKDKDIMKKVSQRYDPLQGKNDWLYNYMQSLLGPEYEKSNNLYNTILGGYNNMLTQGGNPQNNPAYQYYQQFAQGGAVPGLEDFIGWGKNFANTGGFTEKDKYNYRNRAVAPTRAAWSSLQDSMGRQAMTPGAARLGYDARVRQSARDASRAISEANIGTEDALHQQINANKLSGAGIWGQGLGMYGQNKQFGAAGLANLGQQANANAAQAMSGLTGLYGSAPGFMQYLLGELGNNVTRGGNLSQEEIAAMNSSYRKGAFGDILQAAAPFIMGGLGIPGGAMGGLGILGGSLGPTKNFMGGNLGIPGGALSGFGNLGNFWQGKIGTPGTWWGSK